MLLRAEPALTTFGEDERGELYLADATGVWALGLPSAPACGGGGGVPTLGPRVTHRVFLPAVARGCGSL